MTVVELEQITLGNKARVSLSIDVAGVPTNPAGALTLLVRGDKETLGPYTYGVGTVIVQDSTGRYHADVVPTRTGRYRWRYDARDGSAQPFAATEGEFWIVSVVEAR